MKDSLDTLPHYVIADNFYVQVKAAIKQQTSVGLALVTLDFDNFNFINDLFSYETGDRTLRCITTHFSNGLEDGELFSRLHADHFTFLIHTPPNSNLVQRFLDLTDMKDSLAEILPPHYNLVGSGGIVNIGTSDERLSALLDKANFARKQAKGNHINTFLYYNHKMSQDLAWRKIITLMMESALQEREFEMYLQPKVLMKTGEIVGAEALVRWNSRNYGMIYPDQFIPILEQNGFIRELDFFMLEEACLFLKNSLTAGIAPIPISVNFSKMHIRSPDFVDHVCHTVHCHAVPTKLIEIEFTENIYLDDFQSLIDIASSLKYLGFRVSLDDFGSAYSSLNYLKDLPLDIIKIDKGFLNASTNTDRGRVILSKVIELIKSLRLVSVMEGVETTEQVEFLQKLSCDFGQGYFYAKPMPKEAYIAFVKRLASSPTSRSE